MCAVREAALSRGRKPRVRGADVVKAVEAVGGKAAVVTAERVAVARKADDRVAALAKSTEAGERLLDESRAIMASGLAAAEINPEWDQPPEAWVKELGLQEAEKRFRLAKAAWLPGRDAPHLFAIASEFVKADAKVRAAQSQPGTKLAVAIQMVMPQQVQQYEAVDLDEED